MNIFLHAVLSFIIIMIGIKPGPTFINFMKNEDHCMLQMSS